MIEAREFDSAGEVLAAAAALRKKFYPQNPKPGKSDASLDSGKSVKLARWKPVVKRVADPVRVPTNMWEKANLTFNAHVLDYRAHMLRVELDASGDLDDETPAQERRPVIDIVLEVLVDFPGITVDDLKGVHRNRRIVRPRQLAMFEIYRQRSDLSFPWIGRWFGGRDHTTVLHAVRKIEAERVVA